MGVINLTPNSFSDQNKFLNNSETLKATLLHFKSIPSLVFDFGFESTAPMNTAISESEERLRFDAFFEAIKDIDFSGCWISFDTYKCQNYLYFEEQFNSRYQNCGFIFNDVSGVLDSEVLSLLEKKRQQDNFYYILNYTHIPVRTNVQKHMEFVREGDIIQMCFEHLTSEYKKLSEIGMADKIIFDPGFGFSKSYDQNWDLINRFDELCRLIESININRPWLIGVSKKAFLRKSLLDSKDPFKDSEIIHEQIIKKLMSKKLGHLLFRVHDPLIVTRSIYA